MFTVPNVILLIAATLSALVAGLFYAYSCSVNPGLGRLQDEGYVGAMQSINKAIQNPIFFLSFFGTLCLLPLSAYLQYSQPVSMRFMLLLSASIVYITAVFGVTVLGNIPLNEALDKFNLHSASQMEISSQRAMFEKRWNKLNIIRTIASTLTIILVILACLNHSKTGG